jgi:prefoldin subunit 5
VTRQRRDPADKAQEALDIATRKVAKLQAKRQTLEAAFQTLQVEARAAEAEVAYLAQNPHLTPKPKPSEESTP